MTSACPICGDSIEPWERAQEFHRATCHSECVEETEGEFAQYLDDLGLTEEI